MENSYQPYGEEWKKEMMKWRKADIVDFFAKCMTHKTIMPGGSVEEAHNHIEGIINDFEAGVADKSETMAAIGEWVARLMDVLWKSSKDKIRKDPDLVRTQFP